MTLVADNALGGEKVSISLDKVVAQRGRPQLNTVDNGTEFTSKALDLWAYNNSGHLDFIRPGKPVENGYIESFNGKLREMAALSLPKFLSPPQSHSALADRTPTEFVASCSRENDGDETAL